MKRRLLKTAACTLSLLCLLNAPGLQAWQAAAAVVAARPQAAALNPAGAQAASLPVFAGSTAGTLSNNLGRCSLTGRSLLPPAPPLQGQAALAPVLAAPQAAPGGQGPAVLAGESRSPLAGEGALTLQNLTETSGRIIESQRQGRRDETRQALDIFFQGRAPVATAEVPAVPLAETGSVRLAAPSDLGSASPRGPPTAPSEQPAPRQSFGRTLRVGWLGAVIPLSFSMACTTAARLLGYTLHPSYSAPITGGTISIAGAIATFVMAAVMAPVSEEMFFRQGLMGKIQSALKRFPSLGTFWVPAVVSSLVFALLHEVADPLLIFTRLVHSLILSWAWHKEGLPASVMAHVFFNGLILIPMLLPLLLGSYAGIGGAALLAAIGYATWSSYKLLRAERADRASGRLVPFQFAEKQSLALGGLLLLGYYVLANNPLWWLGAIGYGWYALKRSPPRP